jgi:anthranilate phosphoribosyltransferase
VRREIGVRTAFNVLGPLTNPAHAPYQVIGVAVPPLMRRMAETLGRLGSRRALVVHGAGGLDELSLAGANLVHEWTGSRVAEYVLHPEEVGLRTAPPEALKGGTAPENAATARAILSGERGPRRDVVLFNAAAALYSCGKAASLQEGVALAAESVDSGAALSRLDAFVRVSQRLNGHANCAARGAAA